MVPTMKKKNFFPKFDIEIQSQRQESGNLEEKRPKFSSYSQKKKKKELWNLRDKIDVLNLKKKITRHWRKVVTDIGRPEKQRKRVNSTTVQIQL